MPTLSWVVLEGSLAYPSDLILRLTVCAENLTSRDRYCPDSRLKSDRSTHSVDYRLAVPAGTYPVFVSLPRKFK